MPDILIRGLELPERKHVCISIDARGEARLYDLLNDCYCDPEVYEVIKLPSHGNLIDKDALLHPNLNTTSSPVAFTACKIMAAPVIVPAERSDTDA